LSAVAEPAVAAWGLERRFGATWALRGVDLEVARGSTFAVFGSNGAGKTTLLRVLAGLVRPSAGSARLLGVPLPGDAALRRRLGYVGHDSFIYGDFTGAENLAYYARLYGVRDRSRVDALLAEVGLSDAAGRPARTYSRGMVQRLSLARAILHEPDLLLMDEPFSGLDPLGSDLLASVLGGLRRRGSTIVMTTHDFERGLAVADAAAILHRGRVAWQASADRAGGLPDGIVVRGLYARVVVEL
jgi:heme exporter protein A